jgi:hypothetical protein
MSPEIPEKPGIRNIRRLIWLYFWLLIIEGALRKWVLPQLSNPLLIVRDPVVIAAYLLAIKEGVFPRNFWITSLSILAMLSFGVSFLTLWPYLPPSRIFLVSGFGFRSNFLHLPLIFLVPRVFRPEDLRKMGWWCLIVVIPMTALMVAQFRAAPDALVNRTAGGEGEMMTAALGKVRTAATFSFVTGVVSYFSLATAFAIWAALRRGMYRDWLLFAAGAALVIGVSVSGSRSVVGACAVVAASLAYVLFVKPSALNRFGRALPVLALLMWIVSRTSVFHEGVDVLTTRFSDVAEAGQTSVAGDVVSRVFSGFEEGFIALTKAPFFGYGLGIGTNAGAKFLTGHSMFLLSEGEWSRVLLESGPVFGLAFLLWRCAAAVYIGRTCLRTVRAGHVLPLLLFSSAVLPLLSGQFGQPTILGFTALATGLALAAAKGEEESEGSEQMEPAAPVVRRVNRRSPYAERLHSSSPSKSNGSVDR